MVYLNIYFIGFLKLFFIRTLCYIFSIYFYFFNLIYLLEWDFIYFTDLRFNIVFFFDFFFFFFLGSVFFISSLVIYYSYYYIDSCFTENRFFFLVIIFIYSIILFLISPNLVSIFLGWDGLGVISYILVIYYRNFDSINSGILTILRNRIGDISLIFRVWYRIRCLGGARFLFWDKIDFFLLVIILVTGFTKRAQLPFSSWLPFAIAAPTPVSSLVHSSTLVTAGVFLFFRFSYIWDLNISLFLSRRGCLTMLVSGLCGSFETDLKKVIALSTLSQLGLIITILGIGIFDICFFHLIIHAIFKSSLFMRIGCKIHECFSLQDSRFISFNWKHPFLIFCFSVTNLSLVGFPFISGFYSKDLRIELRISILSSNLLNLIIILRVCLTIGYRFKFLMASGLTNSFFFSVNCSKKTDLIPFKSLPLLLILRIFLGYFFLKFFYDDIIIIDMFVFQKFSILWGIFFTTILFINIFFNKDSISFLKINSNIFFSSLFFLRELTTYGKYYLRKFFIINKILDSGWVEYRGGLYIKTYISKIFYWLEIKNWVNQLNFIFIIFFVLLVIFFYSLF